MDQVELVRMGVTDDPWAGVIDDILIIDESGLVHFLSDILLIGFDSPNA
jgi:hypothetical protein